MPRQRSHDQRCRPVRLRGQLPFGTLRSLGSKMTAPPFFMPGVAAFERRQGWRVVRYVLLASLVLVVVLFIVAYELFFLIGEIDDPGSARPRRAGAHCHSWLQHDRRAG